MALMAPMRVCLDGHAMLQSRRTGVGNYGASVTRVLASMGHEPEVIVQDSVMGAASRPDAWRQALPPWTRSCPVRDRHVSNTRFAAQAFRAAQIHFDIYRRPLRLHDAAPPDIVHWTHPVPLFWPGRPNIYTVHDLIPLRRPELSPMDGRRLRRIMKATLSRAAHVMTVSDATRSALIREFGLPHDRVTTTYQPLDLPAPAVRSPLPNGMGVYDLFVGALETRKNIRRVIEAHAASFVRGPLVIAGLDGWDMDPGLRAAMASPNVVRMPWLDRPSLVRLIADARMLLLPSLSEGFGLPVAEAMALGVPVITSDDAGALAEITAGAAMLVAPEDVAGIAQAIAALAADGQRRQRMAHAGRDQAQLFSDRLFAARIDRIFSRVVEERAQAIHRVRRPVLASARPMASFAQ